MTDQEFRYLMAGITGRSGAGPSPSPSPSPPGAAPGGTPVPPWSEPTAIPGTGQPWYYPYPGPSGDSASGFPSGSGFPLRQGNLPFFSGDPLKSSQFDPEGVRMSTDPMNRPASWVYPYNELPQPVPVGTPQPVPQVPADDRPSAYAGTSPVSPGNIAWGNQLIYDQSEEQVQDLWGRIAERYVKEGLFGGPGQQPNYPRFRPQTEFGSGAQFGPQVNIQTDSGVDLWGNDLGTNPFPGATQYGPTEFGSDLTDLWDAWQSGNPFDETLNTPPPPDTSGVGAGMIWNAGQPGNPFDAVLNPVTPPPFAGASALPADFWGAEPWSSPANIGTEAVNPTMFTGGGDFSGSGPADVQAPADQTQPATQPAFGNMPQMTWDAGNNVYYDPKNPSVGQMFKDATGNIIDSAGKIIMSASDFAQMAAARLAGITPSGYNTNLPGGAYWNADTGGDMGKLAAEGAFGTVQTGPNTQTGLVELGSYGGGRGGYFGSSTNFNPDIFSPTNPFGVGQVGSSSVPAPQIASGPPSTGSMNMMPDAYTRKLMDAIRETYSSGGTWKGSPTRALVGGPPPNVVSPWVATQYPQFRAGNYPSWAPYAQGTPIVNPAAFGLPSTPNRSIHFRPPATP
jgi:hypothetical protein